MYFCHFRIKMDADKQTWTVAVRVDGEQRILDVTKHTTCNDVIITTMNDKHSEYFITETSNGVEHILKRKNKVLKIFRSMNKDGFLSLRKTNSQTSKGSCYSRAFGKLKEMRAIVKQFQSTHTEKKECPVSEANRNNADTKLNMYKDKSVDQFTQENDISQLNRGKLDIMKRFLNDVETNMNDYRTAEIERYIPHIRQQGEGMETGSALCSRSRGDGTSHDESFFFSFTKDTTCIYLGSLTEQSDEVDTTYGTDFNAAFLEDTDSVLGDESDFSIDELDMNIVVDANNSGEEHRNDIMKKLFSKSNLSTRYADDKAVESFMQTMLEQSDDDEGVSSMSSDTGSSR